MTTLREAAQQALEALYEETAWFGPTPKGAAAIAALKAALAQEQTNGSWHDGLLGGQLRERERWLAQEPVAWMYPDDYAGILKHQSRAEVFQKAWCNPAVCVPLYTAPPQRKPLTDEEIKNIYVSKHWYEIGEFTWGAAKVVARAIERAHGIGGDDGQA